MDPAHEQLPAEPAQERDQANLYFDMAGVLMVVLDREGRVKRLNRRGAEILECTPEYAVGRDWFATFVPERMRAEVRGVFGRIMGGRPEGVEWFDNPIVTARGAERMIRWRNTVLFDDAGTPDGTVSSGEDVTDERRMEQELRDSERRFRTLYESVQAGVVLQAASGEILHANRIAAEILGMKVGEVTGRTSVDPVWEMIDESGRPVPGEMHPSMVTLRTGRALRNQVRGLFAGEPSRTRWLLINTEPLWDTARERVVQVMVAFLEITRLRTAEDALRKSEQEARALLDGTRESLLYLDRDDRIILANRTAAERLGTTPEAIVGRAAWDLVPQDVAKNRKAAMRRMLRTGGVEEIEDGRDGTWFHSTINPVRDEKGRIVGSTVFAQDVTERKQAMDALQESHNRLRQLSAHVEAAREAERKAVAREVHDELGQLLTALRMDMALVDKDGVVLSEPARARLVSMGKLVDRATASVKRISSGLRPGALDQLGLTAACEWLCNETSSHARLRCSFRSTMDERGLDEPRRTALYRILQEALTNVARHARATKVHVRLVSTAGSVELRVSDNGRGFDSARLGAAESLGLIGMRERAVNLGGRVLVGRGKTGGTVVRAVLPLSRRVVTGKRKRSRPGIPLKPLLPIEQA